MQIAYIISVSWPARCSASQRNQLCHLNLSIVVSKQLSPYRFAMLPVNHVHAICSVDEQECMSGYVKACHLYEAALHARGDSHPIAHTIWASGIGLAGETLGIPLMRQLVKGFCSRPAG